MGREGANITQKELRGANLASRGCTSIGRGGGHGAGWSRGSSQHIGPAAGPAVSGAPREKLD